VQIEGDRAVIDVSAAPDRSHSYRLYGFADDDLVAARRDRFGSGERMPDRVQMSPVLTGDPPRGPTAPKETAVAHEPPIENYDDLSEDDILKHAYEEVDRAMSRASRVLDRIRDYEERNEKRDSLLDDLDEFINESGDFTSRWSDVWTSRWGARN
jgi:hypothetical protein